MTRRRRRNHSSAFKAKVGLSALKGERTVAEPAEQLDVQPNQIQDWKKHLVECAEDVFGANAVEAQHSEKEVEKLHAKIGRLAMENNFCPRCSGATGERAPRPDSREARIVQDAALRVSRCATLERVLPWRTGQRGGPCCDAAHRRDLSPVVVLRQPAYA